MRHPHSAPLKRKASPQRSLRQLHPTTWSQTTRLPITLCHISDFCFHVRILVEFLVSERCHFFFYLFFFSLWLNSTFSLPQSESRATLANQAELHHEQLSHTEHVLRPFAGSIPQTPDGSGVRAALTNNKLEQGWGENNSNI